MQAQGLVVPVKSINSPQLRMVGREVEEEIWGSNHLDKSQRRQTSEKQLWNGGFSGPVGPSKKFA